MFVAVQYYDYRKEVQLKCLGYSSDLAHAKSVLLQQALQEYSQRYSSKNNEHTRYIVFHKLEQTEYVTFANRPKWQYRPVMIYTSKPLTMRMFSKIFLRKHTIRSDEIVTQEWLMENMDTFSDLFLDISEEELEDDNEQVVKGIDKYCTVYAIAQVNEL